MIFEDAQRAYDNESDFDHEDDDKCEDCGQRKCVCSLLDEM